MDDNILPMPFIVGSPRSGTTLLRFMLDAHPDMAIPPETGFFIGNNEFSDDIEKFFSEITNYPVEAPNWNDFHIAKEKLCSHLSKTHPFTATEGLRIFYKAYSERFGKKRYGDKTPLHGLYMKKIQDILPEARFVHVVRDGRDVAVSLRKQWFSPGYDIDIQARYWKDNVRTMQEQGKQIDHYLEVCYEDLVNDTEAVLRRICAFLEIDFVENMLRYYEKTPERLDEHLARYRSDGSMIVSQEDRRKQQIATTLPPSVSFIGAAKKELSEEEKRIFDEIAGDVLREFGY